MPPYTRYAIYYLPPEGELSDFGAAWLGWDVRAGQAVEGMGAAQAEAVRGPARYGFHATLKPPFALADGAQQADLERAVLALAAGLPEARCAGLDLTRLGRFLALTVRGDAAPMSDLAAACVTQLDGFRKPASASALDARKTPRMDAAQIALLERWGYPYVMEFFRFHMTLTARLPKAACARWEAHLRAHLPELPCPFTISAISLVGERADGRFELVLDAPLGR